MTDTELALRAFSSYITGKVLNVGKPDDVLFGDFLKRCEEHKIMPMAGTALLRADDGSLLTEKQRNALITKIKIHVISQTVRTQNFLAVYRELTAAGAHPLCVKGIVCRSLYPEPDIRPSSDEDIVISPEDFGKCEEILKKLGFSADEQSTRSYEVTYSDPGKRFRTELHKNLFDPNSTVFNSFNGLVGDVFSDFGSIKNSRTVIYTPEKNRHLLYIILHSFKHFLHSGTGIRQLCDTAVFAKSFEPDWKMIHNKCCEVNADVYLNAVLLIGHDYFDLPLESIREQIPDFDETLDYSGLLKDVMSGSVYGADTIERQHSSTITLNSVEASQEGKRSTWLNSVFPSANKLTKQYPYLKEHPTLLPVAWAQRIIRYSHSGNSSSETLTIGAQRVELLKQYKIIK